MTAIQQRARRISALVIRHDLPRTLGLDLSSGANDGLLSELEAMTDQQAAELKRLWVTREHLTAALADPETDQSEEIEHG